MFAPNYGAATAHIQQLMTEREEFIEVNKTQALRIQALETELATTSEQFSVQSLISESRARQIQELDASNREKTDKIAKLRTALKLLWGVQIAIQQRNLEIQQCSTEGTELLEKLESLLEPAGVETHSEMTASDLALGLA